MEAKSKYQIIFTGAGILVLSILLNSCAYPVSQAIAVLSAAERNKQTLPVPTVITNEIINIAGTTASGGGYITDEGPSAVLSRGVCWSSGPNPTIMGKKTTDGAGDGSFSSTLTGLSGATQYYVCAYATNSEGTGYGEVRFFSTLGQSPSPTGKAATTISTSMATLNGSVNANYLSTVVTFEYGTTNRYGDTATATQSPVEGNAVISVNADISGLIPGTTYHYRIKATNSLGTSNTRDMTFKTKVADISGN